MHKFRNNASAVKYGNRAWEAALAHGLIDVRVDPAAGGRLRGPGGHKFVNMCSCSYLGLVNHPAILEGAVEAVRDQGAVDLPISRIRLRLNILEEFESRLSGLLGVRAVSAVNTGWQAVRSSLATLNDAQHWHEVIYGAIDPVVIDQDFLDAARRLLPPEPLGESTWKEWTGRLKEETGRRGKNLYHPLRLALTANEAGPELAALMPLIGRNRFERRLEGKR